ncbi:MAG: hypothetical protein U9Q63_04100 [Patescibacteria group bacterium]|nr:hypothetical protein [Patescibacteria group bacterium]
MEIFKEIKDRYQEIMSARAIYFFDQSTDFLLSQDVKPLFPSIHRYLEEIDPTTQIRNLTLLAKAVKNLSSPSSAIHVFTVGGGLKRSTELARTHLICISDLGSFIAILLNNKAPLRTERQIEKAETSIAGSLIQAALFLRKISKQDLPIIGKNQVGKEGKITVDELLNLVKKSIL